MSDPRPRWERRYDRKAGRRYMHTTPWRRCRIGLCVRCWVRELTGINRRAKARHIEETRLRLEVFKVPTSFFEHDGPDPAPRLRKMADDRRRRRETDA